MNFNRYEDIPDKIIDIEKCLECDAGITISDQSLWNRLKESPEPPHIGSVFVGLLFENAKSWFKETYPQIKISHYINCLDTHFYINGESIYNRTDWNEAIEKVKSL